MADARKPVNVARVLYGSKYKHLIDVLLIKRHRTLARVIFSCLSPAAIASHDCKKLEICP